MNTISYNEYKAKIDDPNVDSEELYGPSNYTCLNIAKNPEILRCIEHLHMIPYDILRLICEFCIMNNTEIMYSIMFSVLKKECVEDENEKDKIKHDLKNIFVYNPFKSTTPSITDIIILERDCYYSDPRITITKNIDTNMYSSILIYFKQTTCTVKCGDTKICLRSDMNMQEITKTLSYEYFSIDVLWYIVIKLVRLWFCYTY